MPCLRHNVRVNEHLGPVVDVRSLHVRFGEVEEVAGIDLQAYAGQATALLGRNGVCKTTTLRAMMGLVPRRGAVTLSGEELTRLRTHEIVRRGIGYVPEDRDVFAGLTVDENLRLAERNGNAAGRRPGRSRADSSSGSRSRERS